MRAVSQAALLLTLMIQFGCVGGSVTISRSPANRDSLVDIATHEIHRRKLPLPPRYEVVVEEGFYQEEMEPRRTIMCVSFRFRFRGVKDTVYMVTIDRQRVEGSDFGESCHSNEV